MSLPPAGAITWINITVSDIDRARNFYTNAFDWTFCDASSLSEDERDRIIYYQTPTKQMGGLSKADNVAHGKLKTANKGKAILYIMTDGLEAAMEKIIANGGKKGSDPVKEGTGWLQHFEDTEGNYVGLAYFKSS